MSTDDLATESVAEAFSGPPDLDPNRVSGRHQIHLVDRLAVSPREAAQLLGVCPDVIYDLIRGEEIRSTKAGGRRLISVNELRRFLGEPPIGVAAASYG
jgi:excisionase family DNA binding protein